MGNFVKMTVLNINFFIFILSITLIGLSIFILVSDWGTLDPNFFLGWCIVMIIFGGTVILLSVLGCLGVKHQYKQDGFWTGRTILAIYQAILVFTLVSLLYAVARLSELLILLEEAYVQLLDGNIPLYGTFESLLSKRFNQFYFSAVDTCTDAKYNWFWLWINSNCVENMGETLCQKCDIFSITNCQADELACYENKYGDTCAYDLCRIGILKPVTYLTYVFAAFLSTLMFFSCILICYSERPSVETLLAKRAAIKVIPGSKLWNRVINGRKFRYNPSKAAGSVDHSNSNNSNSDSSATRSILKNSQKGNKMSHLEA
eukprot:gene12024-25192_t